MRRYFYRIAAVFCAVACLIVNTCALADDSNTPVNSETIDFAEVRASGSFNTSLNAGERVKVGSPLPLAAGEKVYIRATYSPQNASLDFGLLDEDGNFHFLNTKTGSVDKSIVIEENGNYTFAIRNNSNLSVKVTGIITY